MPAIAITDYENLYGAIEFYESCIKNEIKPIIGAEINFTLNFNTLRFSKKITTNYITLLAKNYEGYKNLIKLISIAQTKGLYKDIPYIDLTILEKYKDNLFLILGGANSRIGELITQDKKTDIIQEYIEKLINIL
jgi:DNA polymerase-3 subunit alpha